MIVFKIISNTVGDHCTFCTKGKLCSVYIKHSNLISPTDDGNNHKFQNEITNVSLQLIIILLQGTSSSN